MMNAANMALSTVNAIEQETDWSGSFRSLYETHASSVGRFLLRLGVKRTQLEDAQQEVFIEAFRYLPSFRGECSMKTWLYRICVSEARRTRKKESVRGFLIACLGQSSDADMGTRGDLTSDQSVRLIEDALSKMPSGDREAFVLFELEGISGTEIARILEIPEATVWRRLHYARERFREHLEGKARP
jgi:RNA polymerase sigma-70 factor, ECF subfamily